MNTRPEPQPSLLNAKPSSRPSVRLGSIVLGLVSLAGLLIWSMKGPAPTATSSEQPAAADNQQTAPAEVVQSAEPQPDNQASTRPRLAPISHLPSSISQAPPILRP